MTSQEMPFFVVKQPDETTPLEIMETPRDSEGRKQKPAIYGRPPEDLLKSRTLLDKSSSSSALHLRKAQANQEKSQPRPVGYKVGSSRFFLSVLWIDFGDLFVV